MEGQIEQAEENAEERLNLDPAAGIDADLQGDPRWSPREHPAAHIVCAKEEFPLEIPPHDHTPPDKRKSSNYIAVLHPIEPISVENSHQFVAKHT